VRIDVYDNNVDQAIRVLKKKMIREGMFREMKKRKFFEKPSERKRRKQAEAVRRLRKKIRRSVAG
jgi:small subunit ribosomal protein S21